MNINTDEQSDFSSSRRIQTRIISLIKELRLTVAANNRPALTIFVDFLSAFDNVWIPALIRNLYVMEMPLPLLKWISNWLKDRSFSIHFRSEKSRTIPMKRGVPQGSVLAATLFRLYIHFLSDQLSGCITHLFADDMVMVLNGSLEKKFSTNILEVEAKADIFLKKLEKFSDDMIFPVNVSKTKAMLIHNIVAPPYPQIRFKNIPIEFVKCYKYLGVNISVKLGWEKYVNERLKTIRNIYNALRIIYKTIKMNNIKIRRKIFLAYVLRHFIWIFCIWFFLSERQQEKIQHVYCSGLRLVYNLPQWDDLTTLILSREKSLNDYIFTYWRRLAYHLLSADEACAFQQTWSLYLNISAADNSTYNSLGFRKNNKFLDRLKKQAKHIMIDWIDFNSIHFMQFDYFKNNTQGINLFIYKYLLNTDMN